MEHSGNHRLTALRDKLPYFLLIVLCFFPIMRFGMISVAIIAFALGCLLCNYGSFDQYLKRRGWLPFIANVAFFLLLAITLLYSANLKNGLVQLEKGLPFLVFPLVFLYFPPRIDQKRLQTLFWAFIIANLCFLVYLFQYLVNNASDFAVTTSPGLILFEGLKDKSLVEQLKSLWNGTFYEALYYARQTVENKLYVHKTYASQNLLWGVLLGSAMLFSRNTNKYKKSVLIFILILFAIALVYLFSLTNLFLIVLLVPILILLTLKSIQQKMIFVVMVVLVVIATFIKLKSGEPMETYEKGTYEEYVTYENPQYIIHNLFKMLKNDDRNNINKCNQNLISESTFFGYGIGDVQDKLDACYAGLTAKGKQQLDTVNQQLNTHNYYAFLWIAGGIIVLLAFLSLLIFNGRIAFKNKDYLYLVFIMLVVINMLAESTLSRAHGILFFVFFNGLLLHKNLLKSE
ncbi:O-antigen ligase family protein [Maribacter halichondriae]|uniref:O-antigen ligase family protein n=1 Tax=Maribacter halichondriae TaxID=2980554 RepID=UPI0023593538|nr:O-antigen ligase family protein [Maribacter sp. Hal144]